MIKQYRFNDDLIIYPYQWNHCRMNDIRAEIAIKIPLRGNPNKMDIYSIILDYMNKSERDKRGMIFFRLIENNRLFLIGLNGKDYQRLEYRMEWIR